MEIDAGAADLRDGELRPVELHGCKVLLARAGGRVFAVGDTCPHAGGPLGQGVLEGETVVCPWHKAAFRLRDGRHVAPPAVDDVPSYAVREEGGRLRVELDAIPRAPVPPVPGEDVFVIVGAGAAGASAAQTLREEGFGGRVVLVGREDRLPYDRTVLSKYALSGQKGGEKSPLQEAGFYEANRIERRVGEVTCVDASAKEVTFADGARLSYAQALLATGSEARMPNMSGAGLAGVHVLRTPDDVAAILASAAGASRAVVIGGGFIAVEAAGALRERGLAVTVVAPGAAPFEKVLGPVVGTVFRRVHERQGVAFRMGTEVIALEGDDRVARVRLADGTMLPAELVVAGLGVRPATALLRGVALREDEGVPAGADLRVADGLFAAGDLAVFPYRGDGDPVRVEHWRVAQQHGRVAALGMMGRPARFDGVPYFWTIHYRKRLDYVGHAAGWDEVMIDGDLEAPEFTALYVAAGLVAAVACWGRDTAAARAIGLMTERRDWPARELMAELG